MFKLSHGWEIRVYGRNKGLGGEIRLDGSMAQSVTGGEIRVYGGNKGAREFSCGQRDLCRLSEAQPQAGNKVRSKIWDKEKEQHKQEMGQRGRNNA